MARLPAFLASLFPKLFSRPGAAVEPASLRDAPRLSQLHRASFHRGWGEGEFEAMLTELTDLFRVRLPAAKLPPVQAMHSASTRIPGYLRLQDASLDALAVDPGYIGRLASDWRLCPDHVVFLGKDAAILRHVDEIGACIGPGGDQPPFIFFIGVGVFARANCTAAMHAQLRCYLDLLQRQDDSDKLHSLTDEEADKLINWDAEKHRQRAN